MTRTKTITIKRPQMKFEAGNLGTNGGTNRTHPQRHAAKVLDFDFKYIEKRVKGED